MSKARWTALGAMVAGAIVIIVDILGLVRGCTMSTAYMPIMSIVAALLFTYFSYRAYKQK